MKVKQRMAPNPITASVDTSHRDAVDLLRKHNIRRLPVLDKKGHLVGIVSETDLLSSAPSPATSLSVYEIYALLDNLVLKDIMTSPVIAIGADSDIAAAARFMVDNRVGCLPVLEGDDIIGIITETDIYRAFVEVLGGGDPGLRIDLEAENKPGILAQITSAVASAGGNIIAITVFHTDDSNRAEISIKEQGADEASLAATFEEMQDVDVIRMRQGELDTVRLVGK